MGQSPNNAAVIAAAGSRKTQRVVDAALAVDGEHVLITTYTRENQREIVDRLQQAAGVVPRNITVMGWFAFLIAQGARPYQRVITGEAGRIGGLNFRGRRNRFTKRVDVDRFYFDAASDMYRDGVSDFVCKANKSSGGAVVARLERVYAHIFVDEVQDLVGYDLDVLDLLFASTIDVTVVGDPRQHTLATNLGSRNKKYRGAGFSDWLKEREGICTVEEHNTNYRSNQEICDFADSIYPSLPGSTSMSESTTAHDGVFMIDGSEVLEYYASHRPVVLRHNKRTDTKGLPAMNIGVAKGKTFDRVLIFPTAPMLRFLDDGDPTKLRAPDSLYVAATRARHSVAFVIRS